MNRIVCLFAALILTCPVFAEWQLPQGSDWQTNLKDPILGDPFAIKGGRFREFITSFPYTLRSVGPDSNGSFRSYVLGNSLGLVGMHPDTLNPIPELATHWAFDPDGRSVHFKLDPDARWSDGKPVTADDYLFTLEFMRSKHIVAPWYNNYYSNIITEVIKRDEHTISIVGKIPKPVPDILFHYGIRPLPRHFHKLDENWVKDYNWRIEPNTGPYQISRIRKGKFVEFSRKENWWAAKKRYNRHRFHVDKIRVKVIRDMNIAYQYFTKGELDSFPLVLPRMWHKKARGRIYDKGWVSRYTWYNDVPQPSSGLYLNEADPLLQDKNLRIALAHAFNVGKVIDTVLRGDYERLQHGFEGYGDYTNTSIRARPFDLEIAAHYLSKAGWTQRDRDGILSKNGQRLEIRVTYSQNAHTDRLVILREEALKAGILLNLQLLDASSAFKQILEKRHQAAWMGWAGGGLSPVFWEFYHSDNANKPQTNNITNTADPVFDEKIMAYRNAVDRDTRVRLARQLQQMAHDRASFIPTFKVPYTRGAFWRWLKLPPHIATRSSTALFAPFGDSGGLFWIDERERQNLQQKRQDNEAVPTLEIRDEKWRTQP